ncbi:sensor histidine kinase [Microbacterium sp. NPDC087665]|uniref:sensor histidine kinase n=1 Tax=Microbacterium sp. NPDC087665 TaxID=3364194 RepID=UPI0037FE8358
MDHELKNPLTAIRATAGAAQVGKANASAPAQPLGEDTWRTVRAKYSDAGPIEVRLREDNGGAVLEVADSGRGVPAAELPTVFDELARAQNARDISGSGIGLTLVATVVRRHGGDVSIRSVEGAGTMVTIRLR